MKTVLIVSYHFPPLNNMGAKRYGYMCKYFNENGYEPIVLSSRARYSYYSDARLDLIEPLKRENIIAIGLKDVIYPIKKYYNNILIDYMQRHKKYSRIIEAGSLGWYYKVKDELDFSKLNDIDIVIGTFPTIGNILVAKYIAQKKRVPFIAEIRDLISDFDDEYNRTLIWKKIELFLEKSIINRANGIITVTDGFSLLLKNRYKNKPVATIYNGWEQMSHISEPICYYDDYIYYAGYFYEHRVESIMLLFETLKEEKIHTKVIIRSLGPDSLTKKVKHAVELNNLNEQVVILDAVNEDIVRREQRNAKINLLLSSIHKDDYSLMTTLPGKLFELLKVNRPILAIVDPSAEIDHILKITNKGKATREKKEISDFIHESYKVYTGNDIINDYSRKNQAKRLCSFLDNLLHVK